MNMRQGEMNMPKLTKEQSADDYILDNKYPSAKKLALIKKNIKKVHIREVLFRHFSLMDTSLDLLGIDSNKNKRT